MQSILGTSEFIVVLHYFKENLNTFAEQDNQNTRYETSDVT